MEKVLVLSCTNRPHSNTLKASGIYAEILRSKGVESEVIDLTQLPRDIAFSETFGNRTADYAQFIREHITPNRKFIFVVPEYNGSFPGILKVFIDSVHPSEWNDKHACLVGIADGRGGNVRGMEHLTGILNYLKMHVYHNKLPISVIGKVMENGAFTPEQMKACITQVEGFLRVKV
jgi:chromate reductase, NAD(P)H dehydrogenase (quinone)